MRDLDIRGAGNLLGGEQSGFISDLGFDTYHRILDDAIQELKETDFKDLFANELAERAKLIVMDCVIETDLEILIPDQYVNSIAERLQLYSRLDNIKDENELEAFTSEVRDRFGPLPAATNELINSVRLRWLGEQLGFEKISMKGDRMRTYFVSNKETYFSSEIFGRILAYVKIHPRRCKLKDGGGKALLLIEEVKTVDTAIAILHEMAGQQVTKSESEILSR
jgi:transcription-repair coupling factor (superfamily II helicase)